MIEFVGLYRNLSLNAFVFVEESCIGCSQIVLNSFYVFTFFYCFFKVLYVVVNIREVVHIDCSCLCIFSLN